ncbi:hypothetical protein Tco_1443478 [Tanacetum coccineum]
MHICRLWQIGEVDLPNGGAKTTVAPLVDLLGLGVNEPAAPSSSGGNFLQDLLDVGTSSSSTDFIKVS